MKTLKLFLAIMMATALGVMLTSCGDDDDSNPNPAPSGTAKLAVDFDNQFDPMNSVDLELGKVYVTGSGDSIKIEQLRYFISNVRFYNNDELVHEDVDGYHLMENTATRTRERISYDEMPLGEINRIQFALGVDAPNNDTLGAGKGDLSLDNGMFWAWNTGYRFLRLDGMFYEPDSGNYQPMRIHTGLNAYYLEFDMDLPVTLNLSANGAHEIHFMVSLNRIFNGNPNQINIRERNGIWMFLSEDEAWNRMNANIRNMFMIHHAE